MTNGAQDARRVLGHRESDPTRQFLERLQTKGWIRRIKSGRFAVIPLSSGEDRTPQVHEFIVAMELVSPAAISYWSALNHHGMTEQLPRTVFVATNHPVRRPPVKALRKVVTLAPGFSPLDPTLPRHGKYNRRWGLLVNSEIKA